MTCPWPRVPGRAVLCVWQDALWDLRLWKSFCCLPIPWLGRKDPHVEISGGITEWGLFLKTKHTLRHECQRSSAEPSPRQPWQLIMAQPARPPSQAPGSQPRKRQDVLFWTLDCSVPASAWPSPPYPPPAALRQRQLKDRAEEFVPPIPSALPGAVTMSPSRSHQRR